MLMPSCSSSSHPESLHPYRDTRSQSTTSLETIGKKSWVSRLIPKIWREGLLPPTRGRTPVIEPTETPSYARMSLELPHPARTPDSLPMSGDSKWAETLDPSPLPPITILGPIGTPLHHPQPVSLPQISGTTSIFYTVPTSLPLEQTHLITEPHPQQDMPGHGTSSQHSSLYESRHPIASTSTHIYPAPRSSWRNVRSPIRSPHCPPQASRWQQLADRIIAEQQHEEPEPTGRRSRNQSMESSSDSSTAVNPPRPATPFPLRTPDHAPRSTSESS